MGSRASWAMSAGTAAALCSRARSTTGPPADQLAGGPGQLRNVNKWPTARGDRPPVAGRPLRTETSREVQSGSGPEPGPPLWASGGLHAPSAVVRRSEAVVVVASTGAATAAAAERSAKWNLLAPPLSASRTASETSAGGPARESDSNRLTASVSVASRCGERTR